MRLLQSQLTWSRSFTLMGPARSRAPMKPAALKRSGRQGVAGAGLGGTCAPPDHASPCFPIRQRQGRGRGGRAGEGAAPAQPQQRAAHAARSGSPGNWLPPRPARPAGRAPCVKCTCEGSQLFSMRGRKSTSRSRMYLGGGGAAQHTRPNQINNPGTRQQGSRSRMYLGGRGVAQYPSQLLIASAPIRWLR